MYLLHVYRKRLEFLELKRAIVSLASQFRASNVLIEDKASGTALIQDLIRDGVSGVTSYEPTMDKIMRLHSVSSTIENGVLASIQRRKWTSQNRKKPPECDRWHLDILRFREKELVKRFCGLIWRSRA